MSTTDGVVEAQLCKLRDTSDTLVVHLQYYVYRRPLDRVGLYLTQKRTLGNILLAQRYARSGGGANREAKQHESLRLQKIRVVTRPRASERLEK